MALVLRQINCLRSKFFICRSIMTSESRIHKVMEDLQQNPYFDKYAKKIATLQKTAPEEFMERIEVKHKELEQLKEEKVCTKRYESVLKPKEPLKENVSPVSKKLEDIFKVELAKDKNADEIKEIWVKYHIQKDVIAATIPVDIYKKMAERVRKYPTFLFPLPRSQGYEFIMSQATGNEVHFTTLLCYQVHKENAPECITIVHYEDLAAEKGIVLMRGEYDKNVLDAKEAQCLANQFQMYYGQEHEAKMELLDTFTTKPENFSHNNLISELEKLTVA